MTTITEQDRGKYKRIDSLSEDDDNNKMNVHVLFTLLREELEEIAKAEKQKHHENIQ